MLEGMVMNYVIIVIVAALMGGLAYATLDISIATKLKVFRQADSEEAFFSRPIAKWQLVVGVIGISLVGLAVEWKIFQRVKDPIGIAKMSMGLICLAGAACFDYREKRIPNIFPGVLALTAIILLAFGFISQQNGAIAYITSSVFSAVGCALLFVLAAFLTRQGIGMGDIKLISALALAGGVYTIIGTLFFGLLSCCLTAVVALILKKKRINEGVPFGPFLFLGYVITVFFTKF